MRQNFFSRQELMSMPLAKVRKLDIENQDEEALVQDVVLERMGNQPIQQRVIMRKDIDITTPEQEKYWTDEIARRVEEMKTPTQPIAQIEAQEVPIVEQAPDEPVDKEDDRELEVEVKVAEKPEVKKRKSYYKPRPKKVKK